MLNPNKKRKRSNKNSAAKKLLKRNMEKISKIESLIGKNSVKWTFTKSNRFSKKKPGPSAEYFNIKSTIGKGRSAGIGYGKRWEPKNPRGKDAPSSTAYNLPSSINRNVIGGKISPSRPEKAKRWSTPGPGSYEIKTSIGSSVSFSFKSRHNSPLKNNSPSPGTYNPSHKLVESRRYSAISFGARTSYDSLARFLTPGPGTYELCSSVCSFSPSPSVKKYRSKRKSSL